MMTISSLLKSGLLICILLTVSLVAYNNFTRRINPIRTPTLARLWVPGPATNATACAAPARSLSEGPTTLSHVVFSIAGSASTWERRRHYSELWWTPNSTRGFVWLDEFPQEKYTYPPSRVIRFEPARDGTNSGRIARIVRAAFEAAAAAGEEEVRWFVMGDDDTVFFKENLATVLSRYDHRRMWYIGDISESVEQNAAHSYRTAYGGGGFAISQPLACQLARLMDGCLRRYAAYYGSDEKISACAGELGVGLTRESGFHQLDIRGDPYGLLAAHPLAPMVSLHHLDIVEPLFPQLTQLASLDTLHRAYLLDPPRILQQTICYSHILEWELELPLQTFKTWHTWKDGPFEFNTRAPKTGCDPARPVIYFLENMVDINGGNGTLGTYKRAAGEKGSIDSSCEQSFSKDVATGVDEITVVASKMDPSEWLKAPRRQCCEMSISTGQGWKRNMQVIVRSCKFGETITAQDSP